MSDEGEIEDGSPVFDSLDVDLVIKVLANTVFSPFFSMMIPIFYVFQGAPFTNPMPFAGLLKWVSRLYSNQGSFWYAPQRFDWGDQIIVVTGGSSGVRELLANTLAARNVSIVVLDIKPIQTENCAAVLLDSAGP
ncbi:hypothetical protein C8J57DRAFT_1499081 [Mycena rebaudengoi]|nr:hypothetical protein C8J57DRAFT_1499081 [Mycena rebaudengoi]